MIKPPDSVPARNSVQINAPRSVTLIKKFWSVVSRSQRFARRSLPSAYALVDSDQAYPMRTGASVVVQSRCLRRSRPTCIASPNAVSPGPSPKLGRGLCHLAPTHRVDRGLRDRSRSRIRHLFALVSEAFVRVDWRGQEFRPLRLACLPRMSRNSLVP
jgi:hypothetical protein